MPLYGDALRTDRQVLRRNAIVQWGGKMSIGDIHREGGLYDKAKGCNYYAFAGIVVKINPTQQDGITVYKRAC